MSVDDEIYFEIKFIEIFCIFDILVRVIDVYRKYVVFRISSFFIFNLIEFLYCFWYIVDYDFLLLKWIVKEIVRFVCVCFFDWMNGIIYFGILENFNKDGYGDRKVVGL